MYVDCTPLTAHRTVARAAGRREAAAPAPRRPVTAAARRARVSDAIVSQWLLEQVPPEHRHVLRGTSRQHREVDLVAAA